jgi:hypothetical protein
MKITDASFVKTMASTITTCTLKGRKIYTINLKDLALIIRKTPDVTTPCI